jgi:hypothetical protein
MIATVEIRSSGNYQALEGIIATDRWLGPLFTNVRLLRTDTPLHFAADLPFLQRQPLLREHHSNDFLNNLSVHAGTEAL